MSHLFLFLGNLIFEKSFFYFSESVNQMNQPPVQMGPSGAAGGGGGGGQGGGQNPSPMAHQDGMYTNPL